MCSYCDYRQKVFYNEKHTAANFTSCGLTVVIETSMKPTLVKHWVNHSLTSAGYLHVLSQMTEFWYI